MPRVIVTDGQYGDTGKGKICSYLARKDNPDIAVRGGGGANAGHTVWYNGIKYAVSLVPCGFVNERSRLLIGPGCLVDPEVLLTEIEKFGVQERIGIDPFATRVTAEHKERDSGDASKKIGTTKRGMGPAQADRAMRVAELISSVPELEAYLVDVPKAVNATESVLIEGTQGFKLSNTLGGGYPYCTVKDTTASTVAADVGLGPKKIHEVVMVIKSFTTRVGEGPLPGEISQEEAIRLGYQEQGTVTLRNRRISLDLNFYDLKRAVMINGPTQIALTKLDVKFKGNEHVREFDKITPDAKEFVRDIEAELDTPVTLIGTGNDVYDIIDLRR